MVDFACDAVVYIVPDRFSVEGRSYEMLLFGLVRAVPEFGSDLVRLSVLDLSVVLGCDGVLVFVELEPRLVVVDLVPLLCVLVVVRDGV